MQAPTELTAPDLAAAGSPEGRAWMAAVPSLRHDLARRWNLISSEPSTTGSGDWGTGSRSIPLDASESPVPWAPLAGHRSQP